MHRSWSTWLFDFANLEGYELQPKKSVAIHIRGTTNEKLNMGNITMPEVEQATHHQNNNDEPQYPNQC
jgi:hypothetical protein